MRSARPAPCSLTAGPCGADACSARGRDLADRGFDRLTRPDRGREPSAGWHPPHRDWVLAYPAGRVAVWVSGMAA